MKRKLKDFIYLIVNHADERNENNINQIHNEVHAS